MPFDVFHIGFNDIIAHTSHQSGTQTANSKNYFLTNSLKGALTSDIMKGKSYGAREDSDVEGGKITKESRNF